MDDRTTEKLSFIKYLHTLGLEQSRLSEPINSVSILLFHDSVELFLILLSDSQDIGTRDTPFMKIFDKIHEKIPEFKTSKSDIRRLNDIRVNLKHRGNRVAQSDIDLCRSIVTEFFNHNTPLFFKVKFESISLLNLLYDEDVKKSFMGIQELMNNNKFDECIIKIGELFDKLLHSSINQNPYVDKKYPESVFMDMWGMQNNIGFNNEIVNFKNKDTYTKNEIVDVKNEIVDVKNEIVDVKNEIEKMLNKFQIISESQIILSLGLNYNEYLYFRQIIPFETYYRGYTNYDFLNREKIKYSIDSCQFCYRYVLDCAIRLENANRHMSI